MTQLVELQAQIDEFEAAGIKLYAISYDPQSALKSFADRYRITYDLLSDRGSIVIQRFGILNTIIDPDDPRAGPYFGIPFPGTYVVDGSGTVTEKYFNRHYATRTSVGTILDKTLGRVLVRQESPQASRRNRLAKVTAFISDDSLRLETSSTLYVRLEMSEGLHVYGEPLPEGFYRTTVTVKAPEGIRVGEPVYPPTIPKRFEKLGVTLHVYEGVVDIAVPVARTPEWESLPEIRAQLGFPPQTSVEFNIVVDYQACSETICYRPETVRLSVRVPVADLVMPSFAR